MMNFEGHIQSDRPVLVEFSAEWSEGGKLLQPVLHEIAEVVGDRVTIIKIDVDRDKPFADDYQIYSLPTIIIFKDGKPLWRKNGLATAHEILDKLNLLME